MLTATRTATTLLARTAGAARPLSTSTLRLAATTQHPNTSDHKTPFNEDAKPTAWVDRRTQAKGVSPVYAWFIVLGALGSAAAYKYLYKDESNTAERRHGTVPPSEIGGSNAYEKPPTFEGQK
ncbi:hypothetical protein JCM10207_004995 [Rhodosporidiobolus poonsookiae]